MLGLALTALACSILMACFVTERLPHLEDEIAYLFQARTLARGALWAPVPPVPGAFFTPFVLVVNGRWIGKYPIGWPVVLALGERFGAGWLVAPVLGALTIALIYMLGRELYDRQIGILAGLLGLSSPFFLLQSSTYMSHAASCFWTALLTWAFWRSEQAQEEGRNTQWWAGLAGVAVGMLALTRPLTAVAVVFPFAAVLLIRAVRSRQFVPLFRAYWPMAVIALLLTALQPLYLYVATGSPTTNLYTMVWAYDRVGFGPEFGRGGHTLAKAFQNAARDLRYWVNDLFGWPQTSWVPLIPGLAFGVIEIQRGRKGWPFLLLAPFVALVVVHLAYWVGAWVYGPRYYYEGHAGLCILAALGLRGVIRLLIGLSKRLRNRRLADHIWQLEPRRLWPVFLLLAALIAVNGLVYLPVRIRDWHGLYGITRAPITRLESLSQSDRILIFVDSAHWREYAPFFYFNTPWLDGPIVAAHAGSAERNAQVIALYPDREVWYYKPDIFWRSPTTAPVESTSP
jgi:4-amino-4-deoxy-L-arabinose transferase-like glycosyltransferase